MMSPGRKMLLIEDLRELLPGAAMVATRDGASTPPGKPAPWVCAEQQGDGVRVQVALGKLRTDHRSDTAASDRAAIAATREELLDLHRALGVLLGVSDVAR